MPTPYTVPPERASGEALRRLRWQLLEAGAAYDFRARAWRCPSCRQWAALRAHEQADGSLRLECIGWRCAPHHILMAVGMTPFDVAPAAYRVAS
jgi:hypothetical protein